LNLPPGKYAVGRGLLYPELMLQEATRFKTLLTLPPRYRTHEAEVSRIYQLSEVQDAGLVKGFKAVWGWLKGLFGFTSRPLPAETA
jgi:hypothetical protein